MKDLARTPQAALRSPVHRDLVSITVALTLQSFAMSLVNVFVPLLLLRHGASLSQICMFYLLYAASKLCINYPSAVLLNRYGARLGLTLGFLTSAAYLGLLTGYVKGWPALVVDLAPVALAATNAFLWNSQHLHISRVMESDRKSKDLAFIGSVTQLAQLAGPAIGGVLIVVAGQVVLLLIATALIFVALLPIRHLDTLGGGHRRQQRVRYRLDAAPARDVMANFSFNIHAAVATLCWPLYLALLVGSFVGIGVISTASAAVSMLLLFVAGRRGDRGHNRRVLVEGTALVSLTDMARLLAFNPLLAAVVGAGCNAAFSYQVNPWISTYYDHAKRGGINYIMSMEIACDAAYIAIWTMLLILSMVLASTTVLFDLTFVVAGLFTFGCLLMTKEGHEHRVRSGAGLSGAAPLRSP